MKIVSCKSNVTIVSKAFRWTCRAIAEYKHCDAGASAATYGLMVAIVGGGVLASSWAMRDNLGETYETVSSGVEIASFDLLGGSGQPGNPQSGGAGAGTGADVDQIAQLGDRGDVPSHSPKDRSGASTSSSPGANAVNTQTPQQPADSGGASGHKRTAHTPLPGAVGAQQPGASSGMPSDGGTASALGAEAASAGQKFPAPTAGVPGADQNPSHGALDGQKGHPESAHTKSGGETPTATPTGTQASTAHNAGSKNDPSFVIPPGGGDAERIDVAARPDQSKIAPPAEYFGRDRRPQHPIVSTVVALVKAKESQKKLEKRYANRIKEIDATEGKRAKTGKQRLIVRNKKIRLRRRIAKARSESLRLENNAKLVAKFDDPAELIEHLKEEQKKSHEIAKKKHDAYRWHSKHAAINRKKGNRYYAHKLKKRSFAHYRSYKKYASERDNYANLIKKIEQQAVDTTRYN